MLLLKIVSRPVCIVVVTAWMVASVATIADSSTMCCIFIVMESESKSNIKESAAMDIDHVSSRLRYISDLCSMRIDVTCFQW